VRAPRTLAGDLEWREISGMGNVALRTSGLNELGFGAGLAHYPVSLQFNGYSVAGSIPARRAAARPSA